MSQESAGKSLVGIFPGFSDQNFGGIQESASVAWRGLRSDALFTDARLFCYSPSGEFPPFGESVKTAKSFLFTIFLACRSTWPADIYLFWHVGLLKLLPFLRSRNSKVVVFIHGIEAWKKHDLLTIRMLRRANLIVANSQFTLDNFWRFAPELSRLPHLVTPLGLGCPESNYTPPRADLPAALMLGRLDQREDYKGHREMIAAWPLVLDRIPAAELWIAGDGGLKSALEKQAAELGIASRVRFFGRVSPDKKASLLREARCVALPSRAEGFGLIYLEAMRLGRPCLVSNLDAGREVVAPPIAGLAADPAIRLELAAVTCRLLYLNGEWHEWSCQARLRYETHFTAHHFQQRLIAALRDIR